MKDPVKIMQEVLQSNRTYFNPAAIKLFGDLRYFVRLSASKQPYMVRHTNAWTDMFDKEPTPHYRINKLAVRDNNWEIEDLIDDTFDDLNQVEKWLSQR